MDLIKRFLIKIIGKKIVKANGGQEKWTASKTKLTAITSVIILGIETIPAAFGHPVSIPADVYRLLAAIGLWTLRDGMPAKEDPRDTKVTQG